MTLRAPSPDAQRAVSSRAAAGDDLRMPTHSPIQYGTPIHSVTLSACGVPGLTAIKDAAGGDFSFKGLRVHDCSLFRSPKKSFTNASEFFVELRKGTH